MDFLDISSLGVAYRYAIKIKKKLKQKTWKFGPRNPSQKIQERVAPTHRKKDVENMDTLRTTILGCNKIRTPERQIKISISGATSIGASGITLLIVDQRGHWWLR
jgi:2-phosphoglycerate kinase